MTELAVGGSVAIVAVGTVASEAIEAAGKLRSAGISPTVSLANSVKPLPEADLAALFSRHRCLVTVEEHSAAAGFGESVVSLAQRAGYRGRVISLGTPDLFLSKAGSQHYARKVAGIDADAIVETVKGFLAGGA